MLAFNYNRKISRPSFWNLNPYRMPLSEYSFLEGNPRLRPAYQKTVIRSVGSSGTNIR